MRELQAVKSDFHTCLGILTLRIDAGCGKLEYGQRELERTIARAKLALEEFKRRQDGNG
jgi:hypothetical protein